MSATTSVSGLTRAGLIQELQTEFRSLKEDARKADEHYKMVQESLVKFQESFMAAMAAFEGAGFEHPKPEENPEGKKIINKYEASLAQLNGQISGLSYIENSEEMQRLETAKISKLLENLSLQHESFKGLVATLFYPVKVL